MHIQPDEVQAASHGDGGPSPALSQEENARVGEVLQRFASDGRSRSASLPREEGDSGDAADDAGAPSEHTSEGSKPEEPQER